MLIDDPNIVSIDKLNSNQKALLEAFSCGKDSIDDYLKNVAIDDFNYGITRTFCFFEYDEINNKDTKMLGYFSLTVDRVAVVKSSKINNKLEKTDNYVQRNYVPGIQIHHFAVKDDLQKDGLGRDLMDYVFILIYYQVLVYVGACLITVQSEKDVTGFYEAIGFEKTGDSRQTANVSMAIIIKELFE
ncbi:GNAT family N-acetyltransferase [Vagococcus vulneris]|uniref:N-acetyltransferase domain-containing protein n=1 Tax=Vagococcus vulneris TaxID=1977869 RepID=A0A429ZQL4_9ENTE|nr:GNAT family N-acetyltransferase [Vagococcus vulneris]RST96014.1 hypothetical protein CBF37_11255 [Vagococcus vulneris]